MQVFSNISYAEEGARNGTPVILFCMVSLMIFILILMYHGY